MSLRLRLFLLVAGLVCLLLVGQALLVRSLAARLDADVRTVAVRVGEELLAGFVVHVPGEAAGEPNGELRWQVRRELAVEERAPTAPLARRTFERRIELRGGGPATLPADGELALLPDASGDVVVYRGREPERRIAVPVAPVASTLDRFGDQLLVGSLALAALGLVAAALLAHRATRPLGELAAAARRVGAGELGATVAVGRRDEIGEALASFNAMSTRLAALDRENRRLAESQHLSELAEVARGFAHTLRNPLNALGLGVERLAEERDGARAAELAERCRRQIRRIDASLRSFLALASAPAASAGAIDLAALAREVALEALQDAGGGLRVEVEAAAPVELHGVAAEAKAMLQALVVNACEASPAGGRVTVRVTAEGAAGAAVEVDDEGAGVSPEVAERLFAPHVTTKPHGSGMGLYLVERLATSRYGGEVSLEGRAPRGTRARLRLGARIEAER